MSADVETAIFDLLNARIAPGKSVSPEEVARAVDPEGWRRLLGQVRAIARGLARQGKLVILRHNKPADPETFKGVYRLRLPMPRDAPPPQGDAP
ncbi:DUF3253 domain-containing protein [Phenylobacterium sp.]|uniref:DUF3253 domain-containing protein n=1 Tax=Phenylobacterium sp. TaxID=1871053 RepID=UPI00286C7880|nr:DUF3253 domain-containing protein [Phenylobacterium sp.]